MLFSHTCDRKVAESPEWCQQVRKPSFYGFFFMVVDVRGARGSSGCASSFPSMFIPFPADLWPHKQSAVQQKQRAGPSAGALAFITVDPSDLDTAASHKHLRQSCCRGIHSALLFSFLRFRGSVWRRRRRPSSDRRNSGVSMGDLRTTPHPPLHPEQTNHFQSNDIQFPFTVVLVSVFFFLETASPSPDVFLKFLRSPRFLHTIC